MGISEEVDAGPWRCAERERPFAVNAPRAAVVYPPKRSVTSRVFVIVRSIWIVALCAFASDGIADRELPDYRYFRALSIDLQGRPPTRDELAELEQPGFDLGAWIDTHLTGAAYAQRLERISHRDQRIVGQRQKRVCALTQWKTLRSGEAAIMPRGRFGRISTSRRRNWRVV